MTLFRWGTLLIFLLLPTTLVAEEEVSPLASPIRAVLFEEDAGLERGVYVGISDGLEDARLPRIGQEAPFGAGDQKAAILARLEADPPPLLFVLGPVAGHYFAERLLDVPRVFVDTAWYVNGKEYPPPPKPKGRAVVVRAVVNGSRVAEVIRRLGLGGGRTVGDLTWAASSPELRKAAGDLAAAAGFDSVRADAKPNLLLHLRLGVGEEPSAFASLVERARREQIPLLSDDLAHWRRGAAILVLPDHRLLGRVAANVGRRILAPGETPPVRTTIGVSEVLVDIRAAKAEGLAVPLEMLAWADRLGRGPVRWPEKKGER